MVHWNSSPHPISDIRDWSELGRLELRPDFQRREVWSDAARIMLIDTILIGVPMPKVFLANTIKDGKTHRVVIDGQQRLSAILGFLRDEFALNPPYKGPLAGKLFSQLQKNDEELILGYTIDFNEANNPSPTEVREVYARVNKYTFPLTKQELRRADFPGHFLNVAEELAVDPYFDEARLFTPAQRRRYADVEYTSEILAAMIGGIQDKKTSLDDFYISHARWPKSDMTATVIAFRDVLTQLRTLFPKEWSIEATRFKQKADFYSLFLSVRDLLLENGSLEGKNLYELQQDLKMLDCFIEPESDIGLLREYAIKCVSQANSAASRHWRREFLTTVLRGTFLSKPPTPAGAEIFGSILTDASFGGGVCPPAEHECPICEENVSTDLSDAYMAWPRGINTYQMSNAIFIHEHECAEAAADYVVVKTSKQADVDERQQNLL